MVKDNKTAGGFKMNEMRKKKLLMEYKHRKSEMGVFVFKCIPTGKSYIGCTNDTKSAINADKFKLCAGLHKNNNLQADWNNYGNNNFSVEVMEVLPYDEKDAAKTDYIVELEELHDKWIKKTENSEAI